jgi:hypothetical protein
MGGSIEHNGKRVRVAVGAKLHSQYLSDHSLARPSS